MAGLAGKPGAGGRDRGEAAEAPTFHGLFEAQVRRSPDATALVSPGRELSYRQLNERANQLAWYLIERGVVPECTVVLFLERSIDAIVSLLAVLKAGAAYVPIDPGNPDDRIAFMLGDSEPRLILTQRALEGRLPASPASICCLEREDPEIASRPVSEPPIAVEPANVAYVIYTSGSTGRPKGVEVSHRGAVALRRGQRECFPVGVGDRILQFSSLGFDASVWEIWIALHSGALLYIPSEARRRFRLRNVLEESRVTLTILVPSALATVPPPGPGTLSYLILGGEVCPPAAAHAYSPGRRFFNAYGPTEVTICATVEEVGGLAPDAARVPIGRAFAGARLYLLDPALEPIGPGETGELFIGGEGVARGYLRRPALTAECFLPDPYSSEPGARMYRSGDLVLANADGSLEFLGRTDDQVKIRGFRIELGEIEATLLAHPRVQAAVVVAEPSTSGEPELVGYVCLDRPDATTIGELQEHLAARLPDYMAPRRMTALAEMPLNTSGKIDRGALNGHAAGSRGVVAAEAGDGEPVLQVVVNEEGQYAIWPLGRALPRGWSATGMAGGKADCLRRVEELWTDMRPASVRRLPTESQRPSPARAPRRAPR